MDRPTIPLRAVLEMGGDYDVLSDRLVTSRRPKNVYTSFIAKPLEQMDVSELCIVCRKIDFSAISSSHPSFFRPPIFEFPNTFPNSIDECCPLCRTFAGMLHSEFVDGIFEDRLDKSKHNRWCLRAFQPTDLWGMVDRHSSSAKKQERHAVICLSGVNHGSVLTNVETMSCFHRGLILPTVSSLGNVKFGSDYTCLGYLLRPRVSFERVRSMLKTCADDHSPCQSVISEDHFPRGAQVIECTSRTIVPLTKGTEYVTLSYVWGQQKSSETRSGLEGTGSSGKLPSELPTTIEDAMFATQQMGYNNLWVDCYCIDQDNSDEKVQQINEMAKIYSCSVATICALGDNDEVGLAGLSLQRPVPSTFTVQGMTIGKVCWGLSMAKKHVERSVWSTRGWTYQEAILSNRCLFFTEEGVLLICRTRTSCEALLEPDTHDSLKTVTERMLKISAAMFDTSFYNIQGPMFLNHINQYQKRALTYDSDALNAFKGVLSLSTMLSLWAVPCMKPYGKASLEDHDLETGFAYGLIWKTSGPQASQSRRPGFPSWSWLSLSRAPISYQYQTMRFENGRPDHTLDYQHIFTYFVPEMSGLRDDGCPMRLNSLFAEQALTTLVLEKPSHLSIRTIQAHWRLKKNPATATDDKSGVPVSISDISDPKLKTILEKSGTLYLDGRDPPAEPSPNEGIALLLLIYSPLLMASTRWLAVDQQDDGSFTRAGIMEVEPPDTAGAGRQLSRYRPSAASLVDHQIR